MVQKSGCNQTKNKADPKISINGIKPSEKEWRKFLYFFKKVARYKISEIFKNSVGCIAKGKNGRLIHHLAPFQLGHISKTINNKIKLKRKKYFEYFSKKE